MTGIRTWLTCALLAGTVALPAQAQELTPPETVMATVDGAEVTVGEVTELIGKMPVAMRSRPRDVLVPFAVDQLVLRELVLKTARADGMETDAEVVALIEDKGGSVEDAMVWVWLNRTLARTVTDAAVQEAYDGLTPPTGRTLPPLAALRPEIEKRLRGRAVGAIREKLGEEAEIVYYEPDGTPVEPAAPETTTQ